MSLKEFLSDYPIVVGTGLAMVTASAIEGFSVAKGVPQGSLCRLAPGMGIIFMGAIQIRLGTDIANSYSPADQSKGRNYPLIGIASGGAVSIAEMGIGYGIGYAFGKLTD